MCLIWLLFIALVLNVYANDVQKQNATDCAICLEKFEDQMIDVGEYAPCHANHFHDYCLIPWIQQKGTCPICRAALPEIEDDAWVAMVHPVCIVAGDFCLSLM